MPLDSGDETSRVVCDNFVGVGGSGAGGFVQDIVNVRIRI